MSSLVRLGLIGAAGGAVSGLFGIGGAVVLVPALVLWLRYGEREATGTALGAMIVIAPVGALAHGLYGNVDVLHASLLGGPAVAGVLLGTALQQRLPERVTAGAFAAVLVASALALIF